MKRSEKQTPQGTKKRGKSKGQSAPSDDATGRPAKTLKLNDDFETALRKALAKKRPTEDWPKK
jgi:hypothetical protein